MNQTTSGVGFGVTQLVVLIVPVVAGFFLLAGYLLNQVWARNERRAKFLGEALAEVENYLEMPYRVRRRPASDAETRAKLSNQMSDIKARIAFHQAWLQVEAPRVAEAFDELVRAAQQDGGIEMKRAWTEPLRDTDEAMNLGVAYDRTRTDAARAATIQLMRQEISFHRWWHRWRRRTHDRGKADTPRAVTAPSSSARESQAPPSQPDHLGHKPAPPQSDDDNTHPASKERWCGPSASTTI